jgi:cobalamin biosynthesis protein CobT
MKNKTLHNAFPIVAAAIGNRFGIKVRVGGDQAYTTGKLIQLPAYNGNDPDYQDYAWGLLAHEAAHIRYSDFSIAFGDSVLRQRLCGAIEDVRIEHELAKDFPGTRLTLATVVEKMIAKGGFKAPKDDDHPANVLHGYVLKYLRARVLDQTALNPLVEISEQVLKKLFPVGAIIRLKGLLSEVPDGLKSEMDCLILTDRILSMIDEEIDKQEQARQQNQPDQSEQDEQNAEDTETSAEADDFGQQQQDGEDNTEIPDSMPAANAGSESGNDSLSESVPEAESESVQNPSSEEVDGTDFQEILEALQSVSDSDLDQDLFDSVKEALSLEDQDVSDSVLPIGLRPAGNEQVGLKLLGQVQSESVKIRAALQGLVQSQNLIRLHPACRGRKVIGRRIPQLVFGDVRVFTRSAVKQSPNTAIHILLDKSESMDETVVVGNGQTVVTRLSIALEATLALVLAFEGIPGVNPGITAFPGVDDESVFRLLEHGERIRSRTGAFSLRAAHSTPMTEAVWFAAAALLRCREPRKVLMVMTDGQPNERISTLEILQCCRDSGIETVGIGLGIDVSHLFPMAVTIDDFRELRSCLFELSKALLIAA